MPMPLKFRFFHRATSYMDVSLFRRICELPLSSVYYLRMDLQRHRGRWKLSLRSSLRNIDPSSNCFESAGTCMHNWAIMWYSIRSFYKVLSACRKKYRQAQLQNWRECFIFNVIFFEAVVFSNVRANKKHILSLIWDGWMNQAYSRLSTTRGHITDCKLLVCMYWVRLAA